MAGNPLQFNACWTYLVEAVPFPTPHFPVTLIQRADRIRLNRAKDGAMNAEEIAQGWVGSRLDDVYGAKVGKVKGAYLDRESLQPLWLIVRLGIAAQYVAIPVAEASAGGGRVWVPYERSQIRSSPHIVTSRPMSPWHE